VAPAPRALALTLLLLAAGAGGAAGLADVANPDLDELSGLTVSRADPAVLWGHNDTGGGAVLYRFGHDGADLGALPVEGARANDWEDIAAFEHDGKPALLIADTGDNLAVRAESVLYAVGDPGRAGRPELLWRLRFRFPDGTRDCEALAVDLARREILLVSKRDEPPRLYRLALPARAPERPLVAERIGEVPLPAPTLAERVLRRFGHMPTALDVSRDGATAVLVTPRRAYVYRRAPAAGWAEAFAAPVAVLELPPLPQVEAAAISADGRELVLGSEGRPGRLARIALPQ
jgi:hypothetical protein